MKKLIAITLTCALSCAIFTGCGKSEPAATPDATVSADSQVQADDAAAEEEVPEKHDPIDVSMGFCTWTGYAPMFIAQEKGFFKDAGINMDIKVIEDESTYASLLTNGSVPFIATALDPDIKMFASGAPISYVLMMDASCGADGLVCTSNIQSMEDLKGKSVALDKSASSYYFFLTALESNSTLTEADLDVIDMGDTTEAGLAFMSGNVDAAVMWEPELSDALASVDGAHALVTSADFPNTILDALVVSNDFAAENPWAVEAVKECWYKAVDYIKENPEDAYELMASGFEEVTADDIKADSEGLVFYDKAANDKFFEESNDSVYTISQKMAEFWKYMGEIDNTDLTAFFPQKQ